jgi:hypothetical protein
MKREVRLPASRIEVKLDASTLDLEARTIELRWYSGATVERGGGFFEDPYSLTFSMDASAVRLGRLNSGAPLKAGHTGYSDLSSVVGVIEKAWLENGEGHAIARFSSRKDVQPLLQDVRDGILRNVSMEARIYELDDVTKKGSAEKSFLATDWEPMAVALVQVGADPGAHALSEQAEMFPCQILSNGAAAPLSKEKTMKIKVRLLADIAGLGETGDVIEILKDEFDAELHSKELFAKEKPSGDPADDKAEERLMHDEIEADTKRAGRIRELAAFFELDDVWAQRHIKLNSSIKAVIAEGRKKRAEGAPSIDGRLSVGEDYDSLGWKGERMAEAMHARMTKVACPEPARSFARYSVAECAFEMLRQMGQTRGRALDPLRGPFDVIKLAMSNSDFPNILANVLNKQLLPTYLQATQSFRKFAQQRTFKDYRPHKFIRAGDFPLPLAVGENGEITQGKMGESSESITALKYGRILPISWEILVNDDMDAFGDFGSMVARRIMDFESATFYALCIAVGSGLGATLSDSVVLYNSAHGNVGSAGVISNALFGEAFGKMSAQTSIDGLKLSVVPRYVLTAPASFITAKTLLSPIYAAQASNVNPFAGLMEPIFDAQLTGVRFYVLADPAFGSNYVYGTINGPRSEVRQGFEIEGVQVKVVHDFGCGAVDYRYGTTAAGA